MSENEQDKAKEFQDIINDLVEAWCDRRALEPLSILLPAWLAFSGLTDSWHNLRDALRHLRAMTKESLTEVEREHLGRAIAMIDKALWRDGGV